MVNYPPLPNSKRCFKASTVNYKIEAFKLAATVSKNTKITFSTATDGRVRTGMDARGSKQQRCFKARQIAKL
ncbi:hypothetical protein FUT79_07585 [Treponema phagedenis]|nr:hypothetical protein FUT79_07585 [Treponema phagedenis]QEK06008.1 hypothetical protein FUT80_04325 [Treponema phagedenis]TYT76651.1 hypothetical protein FS559_14475 [Treponema phagedenis]